MAQEIENGKSLSQAYAAEATLFPSLYASLIEAGAEAGDVPAVLEEIAAHASERAQIAARIRKALYYPVVSAIGVVVLGLALFFLVGPGIEAASDIGARAMTPYAKDQIWRYGPLIAILLLAVTVLAGVVYVWRRNPLDAGAGPTGLAYRIPFLGALRRLSAQAGFATTLSMLLRRGLPLPHALGLTATASDGSDVTQKIGKMRTEAEQGLGLRDSVGAGSLISPTLLWFLEAGESSGSPARSLSDIARIYERRLDRCVDRICFFATPLALAFVGLVVCTFALFYLAPIFGAWKGIFYL